MGVVAVGCGSNDFVLAPPDASSAGDAGQDAGLAAAFCPALTAYDQRCQFALPCDVTNLSNCNVENAALSDSARKAFVDCQPSLTCARGTDFVRQTCPRGELAATTPTTAQAKLAADYCTACQPDAGSGCGAAAFYREGLTADQDGPGFIELLYNDTSARAIDAACIPVPGDAGTCDLRFRVCELIVLAPQVPTDACAAADSGP